jgi:predicted transcriptional regulator
MRGDVMVIQRQMPVREAVHLLQQAQTSEAPVVDERGRCVGKLTAGDVFRWVEAGCPEVVVGPVHTCPHERRGRLLNGDLAVMCRLSDGRCPYQAVQPTIGGQHAELCARQENEVSPFGTVPSYMTADVVTVQSHAHLFELARLVIDARADRLVVLDDNDRPIGIVSAADVLEALGKELKYDL